MRRRVSLLRARRVARGGPPVDYGDKPAAAKRSLLTPPRWSLFAPPLTDLAAMGAIDAVAASLGADDDLYIANNVGHIGKLNDGSSQQAPAGFVESAVQRAGRAGGKVKVFKG